MSIDLEVFAGEEKVTFPFDGKDTEEITKGITEWNGIADKTFLRNFTIWVEHGRCPEWARQQMMRVISLAKINASYVKWSKQ